MPSQRLRLGRKRKNKHRALYPWLYEFLGPIVSDELIREAHSVPVSKLATIPRDSFTVTEKGAGPPKVLAPSKF